MPNTQSEHIVTSFSDELAETSNLIAKMGGLTEQQLSESTDAMVRRDTALADKVIAGDAEIDDLEQQVESHVIRILALRQPMAQDLREVVAALRIASDLERVGDLAKNMSKRTLVLNKAQPIPVIQGLGRMSRLVQMQLKLVLDAYAARNAEKALSVWRNDNEIDEHCNSIFRELLTYMMEDPRMIGLAAHLLFVAKNLERIGDHATNIAETIYYLATGETITDERPKSDMTSTTMNFDAGDLDDKKDET